MADAVVFDLFHTLVDTEHLRPPDFDAVTSVAGICDIERAPFAAFWADTYVERETTPIDLVDLVDRHCRAVGAAFDEVQRRAVDAVFGVCKDDALRRPEPAMAELIVDLSAVTTIGVLSNCHEREVRCWPESPFVDPVTVFGRSTRIGAMKSGPQPYRWILDRLELEAGAVAYVGNGSSDELAGARATGFGTVIHCNVYDRANGLVSHGEQLRRAGQADTSVDTVGQLRTELDQLAPRGRIG